MDYLNAAKSSETSVDELALLADSDYDFVQLAVVSNKNATASILRLACPKKFDTWNRQTIAGEISSNVKTPHDVLHDIGVGLMPYLNNGRGNEMAAEAAIKLCNNTSTPLEIIKSTVCSIDASIGIRKKIASNVTRQHVLEFLLNDPSVAVQKRAANSLVNCGHPAGGL